MTCKTHSAETLASIPFAGLKYPLDALCVRPFHKEPLMPEQLPSALIDERIKSLADWRGETLARVREIILAAGPEVIEEWKWRGVPVWSHAGILCTGEIYKAVVKLTFAKGAALKDPRGLFNSSLEGNVRRAIDIHEGEKIDKAALTALVRAAAALNLESKKKPSSRPRTKQQETKK